MKTLTYGGNEYHIINESSEYIDITIAYREMKYSHIELYKKVTFPEQETRVQLFQLPTWLIPDILSHQEFMKEIETKEAQEELNAEVLT